MLLLVAIFVVWCGMAWWVSRDCERRGRRSFAWALCTVLFGVFALIPYLFVRKMDDGQGAS